MSQRKRWRRTLAEVEMGSVEGMVEAEKVREGCVRGVEVVDGIGTGGEVDREGVREVKGWEIAEEPEEAAVATGAGDEKE